jgi:hypothetical protein
MLRLASFLTTALGLLAAIVSAAEPPVRRENIEWCNIWIPDATRTDLPRVLLVGDSICNGYHSAVEKELQGKCLVAMLATSSALGDPALTQQVKLLLGNYKFAVVHFNIGLHGWDSTEQEYRLEFPKLLKVIRQGAPAAKLVWATSTPWRKPAPQLGEFGEKNERVKARNQIVVELAAQEGIPVDDLYRLVENHPEYSGGDGVHYNAKGQTAEAAQVAHAILDALAK